MCGVPDTEQAWLVPFAKAIDRHCQQFYVVPAFDFADAVTEEWRHLDDCIAERIQALGLYVLDSAFGNNVGTLPVDTAVEHHHHLAGFDMTEHVGRIGGAARYAKPENI